MTVRRASSGRPLTGAAASQPHDLARTAAADLRRHLGSNAVSLHPSRGCSMAPVGALLVGCAGELSTSGTATEGQTETGSGEAAGTTSSQTGPSSTAGSSGATTAATDAGTTGATGLASSTGSATTEGSTTGGDTTGTLPVQWTAVSLGRAHTCAIDDGGKLWCWGRNDRGQLGVGDFDDRTTPVPVSG